MQNVSQCQPACQGPPRNAVRENLQQASHLQLAAASSERSADITIMTDEADKVTLSVDARIQAVALTYHDMTASDAGYSETRADLVGIDIDREIELSVRGELDDQERRDIRQVLKAVFKMMKNFLAGKYDGGMETASKFDDLTTISSVTAEFESEEAAAFLSRSSTLETEGLAAPGAKIFQRQPLAARDRASAVAPGPAAVAQTVPAEGGEPVQSPAEAVSDRMAQAVSESGIDPAAVGKPVDELFGRLMRKFLDEGPFGFRKMRRLHAIMEAFGRKMEALTNPEPQAAPDLEKPDTGTLHSSNGAAAGDTSPQALFTVLKSAEDLRVSIFEQSLSLSFEYSADRSGRVPEDDVSVKA